MRLFRGLRTGSESDRLGHKLGRREQNVDRFMRQPYGTYDRLPDIVDFRWALLRGRASERESPR